MSGNAVGLSSCSTSRFGAALGPIVASALFTPVVVACALRPASVPPASADLRALRTSRQVLSSWSRVAAGCAEHLRCATQCFARPQKPGIAHTEYHTRGARVASCSSYSCGNARAPTASVRLDRIASASAAGRLLRVRRTATCARRRVARPGHAHRWPRTSARRTTVPALSGSPMADPFLDVLRRTLHFPHPMAASTRGSCRAGMRDVYGSRLLLIVATFGTGARLRCSGGLMASSRAHGASTVPGCLLPHAPRHTMFPSRMARAASAIVSFDVAP